MDGSWNGASTIDEWLTNQIPKTGKEDPWSALDDFLSKRHSEQRLRLFLHEIFKTKLPKMLKPQPVIIVVDQAEELLRAHREKFLSRFYYLAKDARDTDLFRLVLVINSEHAVNALELINDANMFTYIETPKASREAVVKKYGEDFARIFDDCDGSIGIALDYAYDDIRNLGPKKMSAKEYTAIIKEQYTNQHNLLDEITREEYDRRYASKN